MSIFNGGSQAKHYTTAATNNVFGVSPVQSGKLHGITINKTTTGTITIQDTDGTTTVVIAVIAIGANPNTYWFPTTIARGLQVVNSATEDFTVLYNLNS